MLKHLFIKNYILIDEIELSFNNGLTVITGETGAGKSMLIDAVGLICGERASPGFVRKNAKKGIVEAVFILDDNNPAAAVLKENDINVCSGELIIRREISASGKSRCFVDDSPATLSLLKKLTDNLIDLHGQHQHQSLLNPDTYFDYLDKFAGITGLSGEVGSLYFKLKKIEFELEEIRKLKQNNLEKRDYLSFQLEEINKLNPLAGEEETLFKDEKILSHSEKLFEKVEYTLELLSDKDKSASELVSVTDKIIQDLSLIDSRFGQPGSDISQVRILLDEIVNFLRIYLDSIEINPQKLEKIQNRLGELAGLKKKFGGSIEQVLTKKEEIIKELEVSAGLDGKTESLAKDYEDVRNEYIKKSIRLSEKRQKYAKLMTGRIVKTLKDLGLENSVYKVEVDSSYQDTSKIPDEMNSFNEHGFDTIKFLISPGKNIELKPLSETASGGEISRIMLAIKSVLADVDNIPLMVFDEIDQGVSGKIAHSVGLKMKELAKNHQILVITHLPQMAVMGKTHLCVSKDEKNDQVFTSVNIVESEARIYEIAKLLGGEKISKVTLENAQELLKMAKN